MINIVPILKNKKEFLELLLLADEQESMIDLYLERGEMYALYDGDLKAACVITDEGNGVYEIKNIATYPHYQQKGYGKSGIHCYAGFPEKGHAASGGWLCHQGRGNIPSKTLFFRFHDPGNGERRTAY